jgi:hypothetical protein
MPRPSSISKTTDSRARVSAPNVESQVVAAQSCIISVPSLVGKVTASIEALIDHQPSMLSSLFLRFDKISPNDLDAILESPAYESLLQNYSRTRSNYNSYTKVLIIQYMTTPIHDSPQSFVYQTLFTEPLLQPLLGNLTIQSGTEFLNFTGQYKRSQKQPDVLVRIDGFYWPTLVVETGWSEDHSHLVEDAKLWLLGSRGGQPGGLQDLQQPVNVIILVFFDKKNLKLTNRPSKDTLRSGAVIQTMRTRSKCTYRR